MTDALRTQMAHSMSAVESVVHEWIERGYVLEHAPWPTDEPLVLPRWDPMGAVGCSAFGGHQHDDAAPAAKEKEDAPRHEVPDNT